MGIHTRKFTVGQEVLRTDEPPTTVREIRLASTGYLVLFENQGDLIVVADHDVEIVEIHD